MKLVLSARLVDAVVKGSSTVALHALSKAPVIAKVLGQKSKTGSDSKGFNLEKIPFFHNLDEKFEDKGIRVIRNDEELIIELNDQLLIDTLQPSIQYACGFIDMLPLAIQNITNFEKEVKAVEDKWKHVTGFEYTEPNPVEKADISYKYLDVNGNDIVIEPFRIKELLEKLEGTDIESVSQHTNIPKNVLIALKREYKDAFK